MVYPEMLELRDRIIASGAFSKEEIAIGDYFEIPAVNAGICALRSGNADFESDQTSVKSVIQLGVIIRDDTGNLEALCFNRQQMILTFSRSIRNIRPLALDASPDFFADFKKDFIPSFPFFGFRIDFEVLSGWPRKLVDA